MAQDHSYAACPQRNADQEAAKIKKKKNKKNKRKGKLRIVAGIMMRDRDSDSTLLPDSGERVVEPPSPQRKKRRVEIPSPQQKKRG